MRKWLFVGLALLAFSGSIAGISLNLAIIASETPMRHDRYLWTTHAADVTWYAALGVQLIGAWITWRGFPVPNSKQLRLSLYVAVVMACDIGSFLISLLSLDHWTWTVVRSMD